MMRRRSFIQAFLGLFSFLGVKKTITQEKPKFLLLDVRQILYPQFQNMNLFKIVFQYKPKMFMMCTENHSFLTVRNGENIGYLRVYSLKAKDKVWINVDQFLNDGSIYLEDR